LGERTYWIFLARSSEVEMWVGRIIQRITRAIVRGLREVCWRRVVRNCGIVVCGWRARRWMLQIGIVNVVICVIEIQVGTMKYGDVLSFVVRWWG
jgi:hypothetical protein